MIKAVFVVVITFIMMLSCFYIGGDGDLLGVFLSLDLRAIIALSMGLLLGYVAIYDLIFGGKK